MVNFKEKLESLMDREEAKDVFKAVSSYIDKAAEKSGIMDAINRFVEALLSPMKGEDEHSTTTTAASDNQSGQSEQPK